MPPYTVTRLDSKNAGVVSFDCGQILYSYATPVAVLRSDNTILVTGDARRIYSTSTAAHINSWTWGPMRPYRDTITAGTPQEVRAVAVALARDHGLNDLPDVDFSRAGAIERRAEVLAGIEDVESGHLNTTAARSVTRRRTGELNKVSRGWIHNARGMASGDGDGEQ